MLYKDPSRAKDLQKAFRPHIVPYVMSARFSMPATAHFCGVYILPKRNPLSAQEDVNITACISTTET
jgi:hypothetical protein